MLRAMAAMESPARFGLSSGCWWGWPQGAPALQTARGGLVCALSLDNRRVRAAAAAADSCGGCLAVGGPSSGGASILDSPGCVGSDGSSPFSSAATVAACACGPAPRASPPCARPASEASRLRKGSRGTVSPLAWSCSLAAAKGSPWLVRRPCFPASWLPSPQASGPPLPLHLPGPSLLLRCRRFISASVKSGRRSSPLPPAVCTHSCWCGASCANTAAAPRLSVPLAPAAAASAAAASSSPALLPELRRLSPRRPKPGEGGNSTEGCRASDGGGGGCASVWPAAACCSVSSCMTPVPSPWCSGCCCRGGDEPASRLLASKACAGAGTEPAEFLLPPVLGNAGNPAATPGCPGRLCSGDAGRTATGESPVADRAGAPPLPLVARLGGDVPPLRLECGEPAGE